MRSRSLKIALATVIVIGLLAPLAAPFVGAWGVRDERARPVDLFVGAGDLPDSVGDDLEGVARTAEVRLTRVDFASAGAFLEALARSKSEVVLVAAHGDADHGLAFPDGFASKSEILRALERTSAKTVVFAACNLGLPEIVGAASVISAAGPLDARVATIDAIQAWSRVYEDQEIIERGFAPAFEAVLEKYGGAQGYVNRALAPQDLLSLSDRNSYEWRYPCLREKKPSGFFCTEHDIQEEEAQREIAVGGIGVGAYQNGPFTSSVQGMKQLGYVKAYLNAKNRYFHDWDVLFAFQFRSYMGDCIPVLSFKDIAVPGYTLQQSMLEFAAPKPGFSKEADFLQVAICADIYGGILKTPPNSYQQTLAGGGQVEAQVQFVDISLSFTLGRGWFTVTIQFSASMYLALIGGVTVHPNYQAAYTRVNLDLHYEVKFVIDADLGFLAGGFTHTFVSGQKGWILDPRDFSISSADGTATPGSVDRVNVLTLSPAILNGFARNDKLRALIEAETGVPLSEIPAGSVVDLSDPFWNEIFAPGTEPYPTLVTIPNGIALGDFRLPSAGGLVPIDLVGCSPRLALDAVADCTPPTEPQPTSGTPLICQHVAYWDVDWTTPNLQTESKPLAHACVETDEEGLPMGASAGYSKSIDDFNDTLSPAVHRAFTQLVPYCNLVLPSLNGHAPEGCPYTYPTNLCGWSGNAVYYQLGMGKENPLTLFACDKYKAVAEGQTLGKDEAVYFDIATTIDYTGAVTSTVVDLCRGTQLAVVGGCMDGAAGFAYPQNSPVTQTVAQLWNQKIIRWYNGIGGFQGPTCHADRWAQYTLQGYVGEDSCYG